MSPTVPKAWMMPAHMMRIICHWTAGSYTPSENDLSHYHILIDGDGGLHRGEHTIADNESTADGDYAAHTRGTNTGSIGVSMCCMAGAKERPFDAGVAPMKPEQWDAMVAVVAQLCAAYGIRVTPQTVLGHGEVERNLGRPQSGKWDPMKLPFDSGLTPAQVGQKLRDEVQRLL
ncbi:MAG: N-acetylmuramoyl-L-alanine amidase [Acetobacteraceae bacterium]|nr:N-acetylmuramoyl-L-alanine amidase [Acetobacteraceae bacterium]